MRSDFWHRVSELPLLAELANSRGRLDLWPPGAAELTEINPPPRRERRAVLHPEDALRAGRGAGRRQHPDLAAYRELGGLQGAIAGRTDEMVAELGREGVDDRVVARVLRRLVRARYHPELAISLPR
jgi:hypothetical protein